MSLVMDEDIENWIFNQIGNKDLSDPIFISLDNFTATLVMMYPNKEQDYKAACLLWGLSALSELAALNGQHKTQADLKLTFRLLAGVTLQNQDPKYPIECRANYWAGAINLETWSRWAEALSMSIPDLELRDKFDTLFLH